MRRLVCVVYFVCDRKILVTYTVAASQQEVNSNFAKTCNLRASIQRLSIGKKSAKGRMVTLIETSAIPDVTCPSLTWKDKRSLPINLAAGI